MQVWLTNAHSPLMNINKSLQFILHFTKFYLRSRLPGRGTAAGVGHSETLVGQASGGPVRPFRRRSRDAFFGRGAVRRRAPRPRCARRGGRRRDGAGRPSRRRRRADPARQRLRGAAYRAGGDGAVPPGRVRPRRLQPGPARRVRGAQLPHAGVEPASRDWPKAGPAPPRPYCLRPLAIGPVGLPAAKLGHSRLRLDHAVAQNADLVGHQLHHVARPDLLVARSRCRARSRRPPPAARSPSSRPAPRTGRRSCPWCCPCG